MSGSVTALSRSRCRAKEASSDAATCAASTAAVSSRPGSTWGDSPLIPTIAPSSPALARSGSQTTDRLPGPRAVPSSSTWQTTLGSVPARATSSSSAESGGCVPLSDVQAASSVGTPSSVQTTICVASTGRTRGREAAARAAMSPGSRRLPRWTKRRASAERSSVRRDRSASVGAVSAPTSGRSASAAPSGSARSDSMLRIPMTARPESNGIASSEVTPGRAGT